MHSVRIMYSCTAYTCTACLALCSEISHVIFVCAGSQMDLTQQVECSDFQLFQASLKLMREVDDKIINTLNTKLPTNFARAEVDPTLTCKELYNELSSTYAVREKAIKGCITLSANRIKQLAGEKEANPNNSNIIRDLRREQTKLRMLQSELSVEEVVKGRSYKVFQERCRVYYRP